MKRNHTFRHGGYDVTDLEWVIDSICKLKSNKWEAKNPVYLDGNGSSDSIHEQAAVSLLKALQGNTTAEKFVLQNVVFGLKSQESLSELFQNNSCLQSVCLRNVGRCDEPFAFPSSIFDNSSIRELTLDKCFLGTAGSCSLGKLVLKCQSLSSLTLKNVDIQAGMGPLIATLPACRFLRKLILRDMQLSSEVTRRFFEALSLNTSIDVLVLENMDLGVESAAYLAKMLRRNQHIGDLSLKRNNMDGESVHILVKDGLLRNRSLKKLNLSHNPVGDDGAAHIIAGLKKNTTLSELCLAHAEIWRGGCLSITSGLGSLRGLRKLDLDGNEMETCAPELLASLEQNVWIECILPNLAYVANAEGEESKLWKMIDLHLRWNKAKRGALVQPKVRQELVPHILQNAAKQPDVLHCFLCHLPGLVGTS